MVYIVSSGTTMYAFATISAVCQAVQMRHKLYDSDMYNRGVFFVQAYFAGGDTRMGSKNYVAMY